MKSDFDRIYDDTSAALYRYLRRLIGSRMEAEEVLQETYLRLHLQLRSKGTITSVQPWLFRVATNLATDHIRREVRKRLLSQADFRPDVVDFQSRLRDKQLVSRALARLSPRMRQVLLLFSEGFSYREIARITQIEMGYVGVLIHRARTEFKKHFEEWNEDKRKRQTP